MNALIDSRALTFLIASSFLVIGCGDNVDDGNTVADAAPTADAPVVPPDGPSNVAPVLNEFMFNLVGADRHEYIEVRGPVSADLSELTILTLENQPFQNPGVIENVFPVGMTNETGHYVTDFQTAAFQNTSLSVLLVLNFTGAVNDDVDADNDGVMDNEPWTTVIDSFAIDDGASNPTNPDQYYSTTVIAPVGGGAIGGASRIPDGVSTGSASDWSQNDLDGSDLPCCDGVVAEAGEANNTPGAPNTVAQ